MYLTLFSILSH